MPYNDSVINSKILANHFREMCVEFLPPYREENIWLNFEKFQANNKVLCFLIQVKKLMRVKKCDGETFKNDVMKLKIFNLELLLYLEVAEIISFKRYLRHHENNKDVLDRISGEIFERLLETKNSKIKREFMCYCVKSLFCDLKSVGESNEAIVESVFSLVFNNLISRSCEVGERYIQMSNLLVLLKESELSDVVIKIFCVHVLCFLLKGKAEPLKLVFKRQEKLNSSVKETETYKILSELAKFCDVNDFLQQLKFHAYNNLETLNWDSVFELITFLGIYFRDGWSLLKSLSSEAIKESFQNCNMKLLAFGFIISRQSCFEKSNIFPSYLQWFSCTFSSESKRPINTKQICNFFFKFLTSLVPYDSAYYSKVHINRTPWVPADCQSVLSDYIMLVKTQLCDLNVSAELGICENTTGKSAAVFDVENVLKHFEKTNEVLGSVFQAAMFWKEYYEKKFLVELLSKFEGKKSTRHKFITKLHSLGQQTLQTIIQGGNFSSDCS